jgi:hypothetical protein
MWARYTGISTLGQVISFQYYGLIVFDLWRILRENELECDINIRADQWSCSFKGKIIAGQTCGQG